MHFCSSNPETLNNYVAFVNDYSRPLLQNTLMKSFGPQGRLHHKVESKTNCGKTTKSHIPTIQSSFVTANEFLAGVTVNEFKANFALFGLLDSRTVPVGHITTDPEKFAN